VTAESLQHSCPESRIKLDDGALNPPQKAEPSSQSSPDERHMFVGQQHKVLIDTPLRRDTITFVAMKTKAMTTRTMKTKRPMKTRLTPTTLFSPPVTMATFSLTKTK